MIDYEKLRKKFKISDQTRFNRQIELYEKWKFGDKSKGILQANSTILAKTGFGKSMLGLLAAYENSMKGRRTIVVVPTKSLKIDWELKVEEWELKNVDVFVVNSLTVNKDVNSFRYDLKILDEVHLYKSKVFGKVLNLPTQYSLALTATLPEEDESYFHLLQKLPIIDQVDWDEALDNTYVSDFILYILPIFVSQSEMYQLDKWNNDFWKSTAIVGGFPEAIKCISDSEYRKRLARSKNIGEQELFGIARKLRKVVSDRQHMMYNNLAKKEMVYQIVEKFNTKNIITFSESIAFVEEITEKLGDKACAYHSQQSDDDLKKMLSNFKHHKGKIKVVNTARALNQGVDIPKIDLAIIAAWNSSSIQMNQRIGRALRKSKNKDKAIIVVTPLSRTDFKKTQDEKWLESAIKDIPIHKIKYIKSIDEIV